MTRHVFMWGCPMCGVSGDQRRDTDFVDMVEVFAAINKDHMTQSPACDHFIRSCTADTVETEPAGVGV